MPTEILCLIEGEVSVYSAINQQETEKVPKARINPGPRVAQQQLSGALGTPCGKLIGKVGNDKGTIELIGLDCAMLMLNSPFTFVAETDLVVFVLKIE